MVLSRSSSTTYLRLCILSALGAFAMSATAATDDTSISDSEIPQVELDKIVVTATRTPTKTSNVIAQTRVIDQEDLKRFQGQNVLDIIKTQPGFSQFSYGGVGTGGNFYARGYDNKSILVLIDGVRYSSLSAGGASLSLLPADQIDRIEILYGASGSSIYGSDAMGGVIQVFTKGRNIDKTQFSVTAGAGSHDEYMYGASAQLINGKGTSLSLSASHNETDGFNAIPLGAYGYNADDDGFKSDNFSLNINQTINNKLSAGISGLYADSETDIDSADSYDWNPPYTLLEKSLPRAFSEQKNGAANAYIQYQAPQHNSKLAYGYSIDKSSTYEYESHIGNPSEYNTKQQQLSLTGDYLLPIGTAVYGVEHLRQELESNIYDANDRKVNSGFLGYVVSHNNIDAQANVRYDDYSDFDSETTYNLGAAYNLTPEFRAGANYAKGYRAPTFNDLYGPTNWGSNPNLKPETSDNYEAFIEYVNQTQSTRLTGYQNKVTDLIASDGNKTSQYPYGKNINIDEAKIEGVTLTSDWNMDNYLFGLSYDYQNAKDNSGKTNDGRYLPIRPEHKGLVYVGYQLSDVNIRAEYQYIDDYYYNATNTTKVDSYNLVNISGNYKLTNNLSMTARLNNVFNEKYITAPGYNTDGTNFFTSLTYNWF